MLSLLKMLKNVKILRRRKNKMKTIKYLLLIACCFHNLSFSEITPMDQVVLTVFANIAQSFGNIIVEDDNPKVVKDNVVNILTNLAAVVTAIVKDNQQKRSFHQKDSSLAFEDLNPEVQEKIMEIAQNINRQITACEITEEDNYENC